MRRAEAIDLLRRHRADLNRLGVMGLFLYGSVARDGASVESDVDLLIEPSSERFFLFDLKREQDECSRLLARRADIHHYRGLARAPEFKARIAGDL